MADSKNLDVIVVGAGFAGMYALHRLRKRGFAARVYERGGGVGGVWYWNRYPGARCDVESMEYSYGFDEELQQEWKWSQKYSPQPEILRYAEHVAERFDLRRDIQFNTSIHTARFDEGTDTWTVETDQGEKASARFLILAVGCLSQANIPSIPGMADYRGDIYHTGQWPHQGVDFKGRRVAVIGTGSSGVQSIPLIAQDAADLTVFQRTATYSIPGHNKALSDEDLRDIKSDYAGYRARNRLMPGGAGSRRLPANKTSVFDATPEERNRAFEERWAQGGFGFQGAFGDLVTNLDANRFAADFVRDKIRAIVKDPAKAEILTPKHPIGCKRMCVDTGYFEAYNRDNVHIVDVSKNPIERFTAGGLVVGSREYALDSVVFATGYDAMTGSMLAIDIRGRGGQPLREAWAAGPQTYLGLGTAGFPNLFILAGPGSPSVLSNMVLQAEQHVEWVADCLDYLRANKRRSIEAQPAAQEAWVAHVNSIASKTLYPTCNSWYVGANIPGKPRVFMVLLGFPGYVARCDEVAAKGYEGFTLAG